MVVVTALCVGTGGASAQTTAPVLSDNTRINADNAEARWHGNPSVAVDPNNPKHVVVVERYQQPDGSVDCYAHTSYDAMATFKHAVLPIPTTCARYGNGARGRIHVAIGSDSRAYFVAGDTTGLVAGDPKFIGAKTSLIRSPDGGLTFEEPVDVAATTGDFVRETVRITPGAPDNIFVVRRGVSLANPLANPAIRAIQVSVSTDNGTSFAPPVDVSEPDKLPSPADAPQIEVGPEPGRVYVLYTDQRPFPAGAPAQTIASPVPGRIFLTRSEDNGATWSPSVELPTGINKPESTNETPALPQQNYWTDMAVDAKSGAVYVTWSDERNGDEDLFMLRSLDGGATWQPLQRLSQDAVGSGRMQYRASISVAPNGRVDVAYYDAVNTCPGAADGFPCYDAQVMLRSSGDGGSTFAAPQILSAQSFDFRNRRSAWGGFDALEVNTSIASTNELAYTTWLDTRLGTPDINNRDIAAVRAQFSPFIRVLPPPEFVVVAVVEHVAAPAPPPLAQAAAPIQQPPPPPLTPPAQPVAPTPIPPAAPIVPSQPAPMLQAQMQAQVVGVGVVMPSPVADPAAAPQARYQEATAGSGSGNGQIFIFAAGSFVSLLMLALSFASLTRLRADTEARPVPARQRTS